MIKTANEFDDNNKQFRQERSIIRILKEYGAKDDTDTPAAKHGKQCSYLWQFNSQRRISKNWRNN